MNLILVEILGFLELRCARCARWTENPEVNVRLISVPHYRLPLGLQVKIIVSPVDYNHDETAIIFYCRAKDREDYMRVYGIFDTEQFEIIESRITDITIFRKMVEKLNDFGFENEKYKENNPNFDINIVKLMCNNKV